MVVDGLIIASEYLVREVMLWEMTSTRWNCQQYQQLAVFLLACLPQFNRVQTAV